MMPFVKLPPLRVAEDVVCGNDKAVSLQADRMGNCTLHRGIAHVGVVKLHQTMELLLRVRLARLHSEDLVG